MDDISSKKQKTSKQKEKIKRKKQLIWALKITVISFVVSTMFSIISQTAASSANVYILFTILLIFLIINIAFDGIALAATTCPIDVVNSMASQKVKNASGAVLICKKSDKVASICADVIGDVAGILSGVCAAGIVYEIVKLNQSINNVAIIFISAAISGVISAITIGGKALMKRVAMKNNIKYVLFCAKFVTPFLNLKKKKQNKKKKVKNNESKKSN